MIAQIITVRMYRMYRMSYRFLFFLGIKTAHETNNSTLTNTANAGVNTPVEKTIDEKKEDNEKLNNSKQNNVKLNNDKQNSENLNNKEQNSEKLNKEQVNNETRINEKQNSEEQNDRKENCTSTKETEDMLHCNKYPRDDDGDSLNATGIYYIKFEWKEEVI